MSFGNNSVGFVNRIVAALQAGNTIINKNGALFYSGPPAFNNLFASDAGSAFIDRFGNSVLAGTTSYFVFGGVNGAAMSMQGSQLTTWTSTGTGLAGPWTATGTLGDNSGILANTWALSVGLVMAAQSYLHGTVATPACLQAIRGTGPGIIEGWNTVAGGSFLNSFTAGGTAPRYQFVPIGSAGRVFLDGAVNTGAVNAAETPMFNLPVGYRPARAMGYATVNNITAYVLGEASVDITTGGDVRCNPASTAGKFVLLDNISFALD